MGLLEDLKSGKYNLVLISVLFLFVFHQYWNKVEPMTNTSDEDIKKLIYDTYKIDVTSIKNLIQIATKLQEGGVLTNPSNLKITGNLTVDGNFNLLPKGTIVMWDGTVAPAGWALCDGGGTGIPDLRGKFVLGFDPRGGKDNKVEGANYNILKGVGGSQVHKLTITEMPTHSHTMSLSGNHSHKLDSNKKVLPTNVSHNRCDHDSSGMFMPESKENYDPLNTISTDNLGLHTHTLAETGSGHDHNNMPPYCILTYIIKL